ncbi:hypothetical protein PAESOLCIP111_02227 [Paenibacillus solanacearum]|uniref:LysM domain-containing protein n=1 Tax=Paenibacillus solanacearum TaxID=2048548 RepID=A0A916K0Q2_9BACL|nr:hypothetical protein [Paenibacillus solanacearum]CAG7619629.1 hypothetical protein PAESOLCIP111_02227 [Paenibacillus solanacearum]
MNNKSKKVIASAIAASFLIGAGLIGAHSQVLAADTGTSDTAKNKSETSKNKSDKERGKGFDARGQRGGGPGFGFAGGNLTKETATILGVEESVVQSGLKEGKTLAQIAEANGLALDAFVQKLVDAQTKAIDEQVAAGKLKQEMADKLKSGLADRIKKSVESKGFGGPGARPQGPGQGQGFGFAGGNLTKETATILGVEESVVQSGLKEGKTLAQIAEANGLALDAYVQKLVDAQTKAIDEQVAAGKLKQEMADKLKSGLADRIKKSVESKGFGGPGTRPQGHGQGPSFGFAGGNLTKETATILGVEESVVQSGLKEGKTLAQIAEANGLALDAYVQKLVDAQTKAIDEQVAAGKLKQEMADKLKSGLAEGIKKRVQSALRDGGHDKRHEAWAAPGELAQKLGMTTEELMKQLQAGKSIADLAKEKGITLDAAELKVKKNHKSKEEQKQEASSQAAAN